MKRVLVVDDEKVLARTVALFLGRSDYQVECIYDVVAARQAILRRVPEVIISDLVMPGEDGLQLLRWLRQKGYGCAFVLMTVKSSVFRSVAYTPWEPDACLSKPFDALDLRRAMRTAWRKYLMRIRKEDVPCSSFQS